VGKLCQRIVHLAQDKTATSGRCLRPAKWFHPVNSDALCGMHRNVVDKFMRLRNLPLCKPAPKGDE